MWDPSIVPPTTGLGTSSNSNPTTAATTNAVGTTGDAMTGTATTGVAGGQTTGQADNGANILPEESTSPSDVPLIVGLVVGLGGGLLLLMGIGAFIIYKYRPFPVPFLLAVKRDEEAGDSTEMITDDDMLKEFESIMLKDITLKEKIGSGSYGDVNAFSAL